MTGPSSGHDDRTFRGRPPASAADAGRSITLESIVVRYDRRPDRCTITPRECPEADRVTTWLSADENAFVDLDEMR